MIRSWFEDDPDLGSFVTWLPAFLLAHLVLSIGGYWVWHEFFPNLEGNSRNDIFDQYEELGALGLYLSISIGAPLIEEIVFRFTPIGIALIIGLLFKSDFIENIAVAVLVIVASGIFGYLHGGVGYIFIQGVSGLLYSLIFLKMSGWGANLSKGLFASILMHGTWNTFVLSMALFAADI